MSVEHRFRPSGGARGPQHESGAGRVAGGPVKTLNTLGNALMTDPGQLEGEHDVFVSGDDADAKKRVTAILQDWFGHTGVIDLGDITTSRGVEAWLLLWTRLYGALGTGDFNIKIVKKKA